MATAEIRSQPISDYIDARFARVEKALEILIKSITGYNPSPAIANDLVTADSELNKGLEHRKSSLLSQDSSSKDTNNRVVHTHQINHALLEAKRAETASLDAKIKETLLLLTSTRAELLATPGTKFNPLTPQYPVSYSELLSYARRISKFTLPHTYREQAASGTATPKDGDANGVSTPGASNTIAIAAVNGQEAPATPAADKIAATPGKTTEEDNNPHTTALPDTFIPATSLPATVFVPWPNENLLRRGALATIQQLLEKGEEIEGYDAEKGAKELEAKRRAEAEEEEERERARAMRAAAAASQGGRSGGKMDQKPKKQFVVDEFGSDDDDDD